METVLITGGTGLIGKHLSNKLLEKGYKVTLLSRKGNVDGEIPTYAWDPYKNLIDQSAVTGADYIVHLAGAGIGDKRWTKNRKQNILDSRIKTSKLLLNRVLETGTPLKAFVTASGIGYYGSAISEKIFYETDQSSADFIGEVCRKWENAADRFEEQGIRTVKIRTGMVLTGKGGVLGRMITPVRMGIGSAIGTGNQYLPWIHIEDLCNIYVKAIEDSTMTGAFNAVAPEHKTNKEFLQTLAMILGKPFFFPDIPPFVLRILFGEMSGIILGGSRISCEKIIASGYSFRFPDLEGAFRDLF